MTEEKIVCVCGEPIFRLAYYRDKHGIIDFVQAKCVKCEKNVDLWASWGYDSAEIDIIREE